MHGKAHITAGTVTQTTAARSLGPRLEALLLRYGTGAVRILAIVHLMRLGGEAFSSSARSKSFSPEQGGFPYKSVAHLDSLAATISYVAFGEMG